MIAKYSNNRKAGFNSLRGHEWRENYIAVKPSKMGVNVGSQCDKNEALVDRDGHPVSKA
jgi:hypothetical protein